MALNPAIALQVKPVELADPLTTYGKVSALQAAQNQNALAQYQLAAAQREDAATNALNDAYRGAYNAETGDIDVNALRRQMATGGYGSKLPAVEKALLETQSARIKQQTDTTKLIDEKLKQSRAFLEGINPADPNAPAQYIAWHEANHADPVLGKVLAARGITAEQSRARIQAAIDAGPQAFAQLLNESKLGTEKFMEMNKPQFKTQDLGGKEQILAIPGLGGKATVVPGSVGQKTMTPGEIAADKRARERLAAETAVGEYSPETVDYLANIYNQTGQLPPLGMGAKAAQVRLAVLDRARVIGTAAPAAKPGEAAPAAPTNAEAASKVVAAKQDRAMEAATLRDFSSGMSGRAVRSFNTAIDHLDTMAELAGALKNNNVKAFNAVGNAFASQTGSAAPTNFESAKSIVGGEVAKALTGSTMALADREEIRKAISSANSPEQLAGTIKTIQKLMAGQLQSLQTQYEGGTRRKDFDTKLSPRAKQVVKELTPQAVGVPKVGDEQDGYRFKGGNPGDKANWEKI